MEEQQQQETIHAELESNNDPVVENNGKNFCKDTQLLNSTIQSPKPGNADNPLDYYISQELIFSNNTEMDDEMSWTKIRPSDLDDVDDDFDFLLPNFTNNSSVSRLSNYFEVEKELKEGFSLMTEYLGEGFDSPCSDNFQEELLKDYLNYGEKGQLTRSRSCSIFPLVEDPTVNDNVFVDCHQWIPGTDQSAENVHNLQLNRISPNNKIQITDVSDDNIQADDVLNNDPQELFSSGNHTNICSTPKNFISQDRTANNNDSETDHGIDQNNEFLAQEISSSCSFVSATEDPLECNDDSGLSNNKSFQASEERTIVLQDAFLVNVNADEKTADYIFLNEHQGEHNLKHSYTEAFSKDDMATTIMDNKRAIYVQNELSNKCISAENNTEVVIAENPTHGNVSMASHNYEENVTSAPPTKSSMPNKVNSDFQNAICTSEDTNKFLVAEKLNGVNFNVKEPCIFVNSSDAIQEFSTEVEIHETSEDNVRLAGDTFHQDTRVDLQETDIKSRFFDVLDKDRISEVQQFEDETKRGDHHIMAPGYLHSNTLEITSKGIDITTNATQFEKLLTGTDEEKTQSPNIEGTDVVASSSEDKNSEDYKRKLSNLKFKDELFEMFYKGRKELMKMNLSPSALRVDECPPQKHNSEDQKPPLMDKISVSRGRLNYCDANAFTGPPSSSCARARPVISRVEEQDPQPSTSGISLSGENLGNSRENTKRKRRFTEPVKTYMTRNKTRQFHK